MKVIHIESGLGNQMLSYCEYLALKKANPYDDIYIETVVYDIPECNEIICQWNGYELNRIFGVNVPNIKDQMNESQWSEFLLNVRKSQFWNKNWNYPVYITEALQKAGINVKNIRGNFEESGHTLMTSESTSLKSKIRHTKFGYYLKKYLENIQVKRIMREIDESKVLFYAKSDSVFTGQRLSFKNRNNKIEAIDAEIRAAFKFPEFQDKTNLEFLKVIRETNSVAIHARRGDMLGYNADLYKYGYFRRSVEFIKKNVSDPVFIFFCDPGSVEWCRQNEKIFNLDMHKDNILFVDWNKGAESYRDLQLMAECKHQIITNSSFGWWAAYLNSNPKKITCSPDIRINTTHHFI